MEDATIVLQERSLIAEQDLCRAGRWAGKQQLYSIHNSVGDYSTHKSLIQGYHYGGLILVSSRMLFPRKDKPGRADIGAHVALIAFALVLTIGV